MGVPKDWIIHWQLNWSKIVLLFATIPEPSNKSKLFGRGCLLPGFRILTGLSNPSLISLTDLPTLVDSGTITSGSPWRMYSPLYTVQFVHMYFDLEKGFASNGWHFQLKNDRFLDDEALENSDSSEFSDETEFLLLRMNSIPDSSKIRKSRFSSYFCRRWNFIFARFTLIFAACSLALPDNEFLKWQALLQTYELYAVNHMQHMICCIWLVNFRNFPFLSCR